MKEIRYFCLPPTEKDYANEIGVVTGWGRTISGGDTSNVLLKVEVPIMSNIDCKTNTAYKAEEIFDSMLCAGYMEGGKDSCQVRLVVTYSLGSSLPMCTNCLFL